MFAKQHYEQIAQIIYESTYNDGENFCCLRDELIENLARLFEGDNPRFKADKFYQACIGEHDK